MTDEAGDQSLFRAGVPSDGMGPTSLDIRSLRISIGRSEIAASWVLPALERPTAPGESLNYRFEFTNGEVTYFLHAQLQALAEPGGTPVTDRFLFGQQGGAADGATSTSASVPGEFDVQHKVVRLRVPAAALGRRDLSRFSLQPAKAYTDREFGSTVGIVADSLDSFPSGRYAVGTRKGC